MTHPRLQRAALLAENPEVEALRSMEFTNEEPPVPFDDYCQLVDMLVDATRPREDIETELGIDTDTLVEAIIELARFILATRGTPQVTVLGTFSEVPEEPQLKLPGFTNAVPAPASKRKVAPIVETTSSKSRRRKPTGVEIILPDGFSKRDLGRDVESSLVAIVALQPSHNDVKRFIQRNYKRPQQPLSFEMLCSVWMFARLGRLSGLAKVSETSSFVRNCVLAWDTLEVARRDAMEALLVLQTSNDPDQLHLAASKLLPLWEADAREFMRMIEIAGPDSAAFERARTWLAKRVAAGQLIVDSVEHLAEGQVRRIATLVGLDTEVISRLEESYIRQHLVRLKLERDAEQLIPIGVVAVRAGLEDEFLQACARRVAGDEDWDSVLTLALAR